MIDFVTAINVESHRFSELMRTADLSAPVPSCPGWSMADLAWHLLEVQSFWTNVVAGPLTSPESIVDLERPGDAELPALFDEQTNRLVAELRSQDPAEECWSWHDNGHNVGWVARRQAHEALIHRVDAELGVGGAFTVDAELAADGVDEALRLFLDSSTIPDWASFDPDGTTASIQVEAGASWSLKLGRFIGTSPSTGNSYDDPALLLVDDVAGPTTIVTGVAADLDLWLWGRGSIKTLQIEGDVAVAGTIRSAAAAGMQ